MQACVIDLAGGFGPLNSYLELVEPMAALGWEFNFVVPDTTAEQVTAAVGASSVRTVSPTKNRFPDLRVARVARQVIREGADIVHANTTSAARPAILAAKECRKPLVLHLRNSALSRGERIFVNAMLRLPLRVTAIAVSGAAAGVAGPFVEARSTVVPDAVSAVPQRSVRPIGHPARVGIVANLMPTKGFDVFVEIVELSSKLDVVFEVFGSAGSEEPGTEMVRAGRARLQELAVADRVHFYGEVPRLSDHYCDLDAMLITSRRESFSRVAAESLLASVPLIAPRIPGLIDTIGGGKYAETYGVGDAAGAVIGLERVLTDYGAASEMARAGHDWAADRFAADRIARELDSIYRTACGSSSS